MNIRTNVNPATIKSTDTAYSNPRISSRFFAAAAFSLASAFVLNACAAQAGDNQRISTPKHFGAGIDINGQPRVEDTGLPLYPGAAVDRTPSSERSEREERGNQLGRRTGTQINSDEEGVNLNLWFGSYGLKMVVVKLKTGDSVEQVSTFYRDALSKYGTILDCSDADNSRRESGRKSASLGVEVWSDADAGIEAEPASKGSTKANSSQKSTQLTCKDGQMHSASIGRGKLYKTGSKQKQYGVAVQSQGDGTTFQLFHFEKRGGDD